MKCFQRLCILLCVYVFTLGILASVNVLINIFDGSIITIQWQAWIITACIIVGTQLIFILPLVKPPRLTIQGKSLLLSICMAGVIASVLTFGLVSLVYSVITTLVLNVPNEDEMQEELIWVILVASWIVWSICLIVFVLRKKRDPSILVKVTSWLFAGSLVEFLLSIPLAIMVARRSNCYCATGSFIALSLSFFATLWLFGPCMVILLVWRKRPWTKDHCMNCGYPRKLAHGDVCSECGTEL